MSLDTECCQEDRLIVTLKYIIRYAVRVLAVLMTAVIIWSVIDVAQILFVRVAQPPVFLLSTSDILKTFGDFLAALIAIEIFINIAVYLRDDVIHVKVVLATALMAIARKVIVMDFSQLTAMYVFATAALVAAMSFGYWLVVVLDQRKTEKD